MGHFNSIGVRGENYVTKHITVSSSFGGLRTRLAGAGLGRFLRREQNDSNSTTENSVTDESNDLVNHPSRYRYRVWPQTFRDVGDSVSRPFALQ